MKALAFWSEVAVGCHVDQLMNSVQVVVSPDGADVLLVDLVIRRGQPTVTDQDCTGNFLVQHQSHFRLQLCHDVKVGDVDNVIAVELLLLVHGSGVVL